MRGYGRSSAPLGIDEYRMTKHVADNLSVVEALGEKSAIIVGHDWGAQKAATSALLRPDVFRALALLSVPYSPRGARRPREAFRVMSGKEEFYIEYFQSRAAPKPRSSRTSEGRCWGFTTAPRAMRPHRPPAALWPRFLTAAGCATGSRSPRSCRDG